MSASDPVAKRIAEYKEMVRLHKVAHAHKLKMGDDEAAIAELQAIVKLEERIEDMERFERLREMTSDR